MGSVCRVCVCVCVGGGVSISLCMAVVRVECDRFVTDGHLKILQSLKACEK